MQEAQAELTQLEQLLRVGNASGFIDAVEAATAQQADFVLTTKAAFAGEPDLLHTAERYAELHSAKVRIIVTSLDEDAA